MIKAKATVAHDNQLLDVTKRADIFSQKAEIVMLDAKGGANGRWQDVHTIKATDYPRGQRVVVIALNDNMKRLGLRLLDEGYVVYVWENIREVSVSFDNGINSILDPLFLYPKGPKSLSFDHPVHKVRRSGKPRVRVPSGLPTTGSNRQPTPIYPSEDNRSMFQNHSSIDTEKLKAKVEAANLTFNFAKGADKDTPTKEIRAIGSTYQLKRAMDEEVKLFRSEFYEIVSEDANHFYTIPGWQDKGYTAKTYNKHNPYKMDKSSPFYALVTLIVPDEDAVSNKKMIACRHKHSHECFNVLEEKDGYVHLETTDHVDFCVSKRKIGYHESDLFVPLFEQ